MAEDDGDSVIFGSGSLTKWFFASTASGTPHRRTRKSPPTCGHQRLIILSSARPSIPGMQIHYRDVDVR